jgi:hypothetical protein
MVVVIFALTFIGTSLINRLHSKEDALPKFSWPGRSRSGDQA